MKEPFLTLQVYISLQIISKSLKIVYEQKAPVSLISYAVFGLLIFSEKMHILTLISRLVGKLTNIEDTPCLA